MNLLIIRWVRIIAVFIACISTFHLIKLSFQKTTSEAILKSADKIIMEKLLKKEEGYFSYRRIESYLEYMGINYAFGKNISPSFFILGKFFLAVLFFILLNVFMPIYFAALLGIVCFFLPDAVFSISNKQDNDAILLDLQQVYETLQIQTKAGVYLTNALMECYLVTKNKRLKQAFLDLNGHITTKKNIESGILEFNKKFKNPYLDTFCVVILQGDESGKTAQILEDLTEQIKFIRSSLETKRTEAMRIKFEGLQFLLFTIVVLILGFGAYMEFTTSLKIF